MCESISANYSMAQDLVNLPLLPFSFVYSVTPMTIPQNAINKQTMSSIQLVFHTSTAMTKMERCGDKLVIRIQRLQWPLMCLCLFLWRPMKGTNTVNKLSQMQQTTPCLIQDGHHLLAKKTFTFQNSRKVPLQLISGTGKWHVKIIIKGLTGTEFSCILL